MNRNQIQGYWVTKKNDLIEASYSLSLNEQKLVLILASLISPSDKEFNKVTLKTLELSNILNIVPEALYRDLPFITENLLHRVVTIREKDELIQTAFLSSAVYNSKEGTVKLAFSKEFKPYLLQVKESFTTYRLVNTLNMNSRYSIRLYEILKSKAYKKQPVEFSLDELKTMFGLSKKKAYEQYTNFKSRVLEKSVSEINEKTDIEVSYQPKKNGRKVCGVVFSIKNKEQTEVFEMCGAIPVKKGTAKSQKPKQTLIDKSDVFSYVKTTYCYKTKLEVSSEEIEQICKLFNYDLNEFSSYAQQIPRSLKDPIKHAINYLDRYGKTKARANVKKEIINTKENDSKELSDEDKERKIARMKQLKDEMDDFLNSLPKFPNL